MIVVDPALVTLCSPATDGTVLDREWVGGDTDGQCPDEPPLGGTVVGGEVGEPERDPRVVAEDDVDPVGNTTLQAGQLLGIVTKLEDGGRTDVGGELGVLGLIGEAAQ